MAKKPIDAGEKANVKDATKSASSVKAEDKEDIYKLFTSAKPEPIAFNIQVAGEQLRASRDKSGDRLIWRCPKEKVERLKAHHHYVTGRIIECED